MEENPHISTSQFVRDYDIPRSSVCKVLEKWHPYKMHLIHKLTENDPDRQMEIKAKYFMDTLYV